MSVWVETPSRARQWIVLPVSAQTGDFISSEKRTGKRVLSGECHFSFQISPAFEEIMACSAWPEFEW